MKQKLILWAPLAMFALFVGMAVYGLVQPDDRTIRSQMIDKPLPEFALAPGLPGKPGLSSADFRDGKPRLLNVFASWCLPCAAEAPQLMQLARAGVTIEAVAIRDRPDDVAAFVGRYGNPYHRIGSDPTSKVQIALGSSGVPETFVVDGKGVIRHQIIGDIRPENVPEVLALVEGLK